MGKLSEMTPRETQVASAVLDDYPERALSSASAIAQASGTSTATVIRFVETLGFPSLRAFHAALRQEAKSIYSALAFYKVPSQDLPVRDTVADIELSAVHDTCMRITEGVLANIRAILTRPTLWVHGGRFSHPAALYLLNHLRWLRPRVSDLCASHESITDAAAQVSTGSGLVLFDFRDYDLEAVFAARYVREHRGHILLFTDAGVSPAAQFADQVVVAGVNQPLPSLTSVLAAIDLVVVDFIENNQQIVKRQEDSVAASRQMLERLRTQQVGQRARRSAVG